MKMNKRLLIFLFCMPAFSLSSFAHGVQGHQHQHQHQHQKQAEASDHKPKSHFESLEQASDTLNKVVQLFFSGRDEEALATLNSYSLRFLGDSTSESFMDALGLRSPISVRWFEPKMSPVPQVASVQLLIYTAQRPVLLRFELYAPHRGKWQINNVAIIGDIPRIEEIIVR